MIAFSPGIVQACFDLLELTGRQSLPFDQIAASFARLGGLPSQTVMETAQALRWVAASEQGLATLTPPGSRIVELAGYEARLRQALLDYIDAQQPAWLQNAAFGRSRVLAFAGGEIAQVFVEAGLARGTERGVIEFWDALSARARGQRNSRLSEIGREGERLTLAHEESRTGRKPQWVAIDNNADGYDVLSVRGPDDGTQLSIEVKATLMGLVGAFHLTANEWDRAVFFDDCHAFHLWDLSRSSPRLAVLAKSDVEPHIPENRGEGTWESAEIPFRPFAEMFYPHERQAVT
jgi:hypothetical protein